MKDRGYDDLTEFWFSIFYLVNQNLRGTKKIVKFRFKNKYFLASVFKELIVIWNFKKWQRSKVKILFSVHC